MEKVHSACTRACTAANRWWDVRWVQVEGVRGGMDDSLMNDSEVKTAAYTPLVLFSPAIFH